MLNRFPKRVILWGAVGQAHNTGWAIRELGGRIVAVFDDNISAKTPFPNVPIHHGWEAFLEWLKGEKPEELGFTIGINNRGALRLELHERLKELGLTPATMAHPSAVIADDAQVGEGSQLMAGVIIGPGTQVGRQVIINTRASIDHDCVLADGCEIAPGATLCGHIHLGANAFIAAGATVLPGVKIGAGAIVGAGALVTKEVPEKTTVVGAPAKPLEKK